MGKRIGYAKIGRTITLDRSSWGVVGGDDEPPLTLLTLARRNPEHEFVIIGRNNDDLGVMSHVPSNVVNGWTPELRDAFSQVLRDRQDGRMNLDKVEPFVLFELIPALFDGLDEMIIWAGQHGTSNSRILTVKGDRYTTPQDSFINYGMFLVRGINYWRNEDPLTREEVWLCPDVRNYVKARDLKWPLRHPVISQHEHLTQAKHHRFGDTSPPESWGFDARWDSEHAWVTKHRYTYDRLEICGITPEHVDSTYADNFEERAHFGLFINEARAYVGKNRKDAVRDWVLPQAPAFIHGSWSDKSRAELGVDIRPAPADDYYDRLRSVKTTFTTPSSGSGWATTKPWQAFATGTVCFFHPDYDDQGHIIPTRAQLRTGEVDPTSELGALASWLRPETPEQLAAGIAAVSSSRDTWSWLAGAQRRLYDMACDELRYARTIEQRLGLEATS